MVDIINKIIGVFLAFALLVAGPLVISTLMSELEMKRSVMNETTNFIDKVTDIGVIDDGDVGDFNLGISSHGTAINATIKRFVRVVNPDGTGGTYTTYTLSDNINTWNKGDIIQVHVEAIDYTGGQRIMHRLLKFAMPKFEFTLSGMVRN
ncbi:hypothetical protein [Cytobacillus sp. IB215316]|uniref:hypothetical protein n=1 Tax=Cytobacillus sp. IB215316 TaxID=3097354 RepID=UPI002A0AD06B|nr:hypothetical protein [Cytobacillus sp. IB215316]MDX8360769.1 hypothetical protein [Cytobacillus sp. IB215316]